MNETHAQTKMLQGTETELHLTGKRKKRRFKAYAHTWLCFLKLALFPAFFFNAGCNYSVRTVKTVLMLKKSAKLVNKQFYHHK